MRRWVVRVRMPDRRRERERDGWVSLSGSMSTEERRKHSTSPERRTGRPLEVSSAGGSHLPDIEVAGGRKRGGERERDFFTGLIGSGCGGGDRILRFTKMRIKKVNDEFDQLSLFF